MIPEQTWGTAAATEFLRGAGIDTPNSDNKQVVGCFGCIREGEYTIPSVIYYLDGTSYCEKHMVS